MAGMSHTTGLRATGEELRSFIEMASTFKPLVSWRSVYLFYGTRSLVKG